ncbi:hypothetical protein KFL_006860060 [Klebsormidium nitens]|uniref:Glycosyl hydrolase-like 10 domain-containing protein n=1 Tax=Klebsormidium nitens TaxID=105231 RepID=A0A1Y1IRP3_KLENI|nr:hypothetical protein KFL_006860060 [Klebsormidium nitens]|eukprot:GAQ90798.1 hypothetical protein KFL_006860060 [Klebsormidium nitens]
MESSGGLASLADRESEMIQGGLREQLVKMSFLTPYPWEDPAFRKERRLPNLRYGDQIRALWVTRWDFYEKEDIADIMRTTADAGFNTVFFQVRGNGTVLFSSRLEPWSEAYHYRHPGFDPLQEAIREAHSRNMALHAWINVMPMWAGLRPPSHPDQLWNKHPEWSWFDRNGERQPLQRGFYVSANPCLPEVRRHISAVCREVLSRYEVDGIHLDYIRFPNEWPVENGREYPRDERTLALFHADTGLDSPESFPAVWDQWRCDCVTALLKDIHRGVKSLRPAAVLTAAVGVQKDEALARFQDVETWWKERLIDAVIPMNYTNCHRDFRSKLEADWRAEWRALSTFANSLWDRSLKVRERPRPPRPLRRTFKRLRDKWRHRQEEQATNPDEPRGHQWAPPPPPGVIVGMSVEYGPTAAHQKQLMLALQRFGHFAIFCYSALFESSRAGGAIQNGAPARARRRAELVPFLKVLAAAAESKTAVVAAVASAALGGRIARTPTTSAAVTAAVTGAVSVGDETEDGGRGLEELRRRLQGFPMHPEEAAFQGEKVTSADAAAVLSTLEGGQEEGGEGLEEPVSGVVSTRLTVGGRSVKGPNGEIVTFRRRTFIRGVKARDERKKQLREAFGRATSKARGRATGRPSGQRRSGVSEVDGLDVRLGGERDQIVTRVELAGLATGNLNGMLLSPEFDDGELVESPLLDPQAESGATSGVNVGPVDTYLVAERDAELVESVNAPPETREDMQWEAAKLKAVTTFDDATANGDKSLADRIEDESVDVHIDRTGDQIEGEGRTVLDSGAPFGHLSSMLLEGGFARSLEGFRLRAITQVRRLRQI